MEYIKLGNSDLSVSRICLGCMGFGDATIGQHSWTIGEKPTREMFPFCREENIAMTPYSALASGKLAKRPGETSKRQQEDAFMHFKYDSTAEQDSRIVERVVELADRYGVEMTQIALAWLLTKVESPIVGATKLHHIVGAVKSLDVHLTADDIRYLEEPYVPHNLSGVMAVNKPVMDEEPVWVAASKNK